MPEGEFLQKSLQAANLLKSCSDLFMRGILPGWQVLFIHGYLNTAPLETLRACLFELNLDEIKAAFTLPLPPFCLLDV